MGTSNSRADDGDVGTLDTGTTESAANGVVDAATTAPSAASDNGCAPKTMAFAGGDPFVDALRRAFGVIRGTPGGVSALATLAPAQVVHIIQLICNAFSQADWVRGSAVDVVK